MMILVDDRVKDFSCERALIEELVRILTESYDVDLFEAMEIVADALAASRDQNNTWVILADANVYDVAEDIFVTFLDRR